MFRQYIDRINELEKKVRQLDYENGDLQDRIKALEEPCMFSVGDEVTYYHKGSISDAIVTKLVYSGHWNITVYNHLGREDILLEEDVVEHKVRL